MSEVNYKSLVQGLQRFMDSEYILQKEMAMVLGVERSRVSRLLSGKAEINQREVLAIRLLLITKEIKPQHVKAVMALGMVADGGLKGVLRRPLKDIAPLVKALISIEVMIKLNQWRI